MTMKSHEDGDGLGMVQMAAVEYFIPHDESRVCQGRHDSARLKRFTWKFHWLNMGKGGECTVHRAGIGIS